MKIDLNSTEVTAAKCFLQILSIIDTKLKTIKLLLFYLFLQRPEEDSAKSPSAARSKSSSSGLRLAFYPEHILWEWELWSRLCDHIKQWLFVVNKARAACRGPFLSLSPSPLAAYGPLSGL